MTPLGYEAKKRTLKIDQVEAEMVRLLFKLYLDLGCVRRVTEAAARLGLKSRRRVFESDKVYGGVPFTRGRIYHLLSNPVYVGRIRHKGNIYDGQHPAIIDRATWDAVQAKLAEKGVRAKRRETAAAPSPLAGKFTDETGDQLTPSLAVKRGRRHCYYVSRRLIANSGECDLSGWRLPAAMLETAVATLIRNTLDDPAAPAHLIIAATPSEVVRVRETTKHLAKLLAGPGRRGVLMRLVASERIAPGKLSISLDRGMLAELLESPADRIAAAALTIEGGFILRRRGVGAKIVLDGAAPEIDEKLLRNLARGWSWFEEIKRGATMHGIASREGVSQRRVAQLVDISFLAPDTVDAIVAGRQPMRLTTDMLMKSPHLPLWKDQRAMIAAL